MKWTTKATAQRILSHVPGGQRLYYEMQRTIGGLRSFDIEDRVRQGQALLKALDDSGESVEGQRTLEIGTGWAPVIPLLFMLYGQRECDTYDISRLMRTDLTQQAARQLLELLAAPSPLLTSVSSRSGFAERFASAQLLAAGDPCDSRLLAQCGIRYHAPADASATGLGNNCIDLVFSNVVLEHIPVDVVHGIFREARRVLRPNGRMVHLIDLSDHFSHGRPSDEITSINFLRYSDREFRRYNTKFMYQNRLRPPVWRALFRDHGFEIESWQAQIDAVPLARYSTIKVDQAYNGFSADDNCTRNILVVARKAGS